MSYNKETDKIMYVIGLITAGLFAAALGFFYVKEDLLRSLMPPCIFHAITGFYCPGCGATRAVYALFQLQFFSALKYNAFVPYVILLGSWFLISQTVQRVSRDHIRIGMHFRNIYVYTGIGILLLNWIIKNLLLIWNISVM